MSDFSPQILTQQRIANYFEYLGQSVLAVYPIKYPKFILKKFTILFTSY